MAADDLAMWGARSSAAMVLTCISENIPAQAPDVLMVHDKIQKPQK